MALQIQTSFTQGRRFVSSSDLVTCPRCGRIHPRGYKCTVGRTKPKTYTYEETKLRNKSVWVNKSKQIRADAGYLCEVCKDKGIYNYRDLSVHHIEKIRDRKDLWLEDDNLICLCKDHHRLAEAGLIDKEYLRMLAKKRIQETGGKLN